MKKVFLTGASSGIGLAIANSLIARGDEVWGTSRSLVHLEHVHGLHSVRLDLSDARSIKEAFESALSEAGYFDVVINNAGSGHFAPAEYLCDEEIEKQFQVLVFGHLQLMRLALAPNDVVVEVLKEVIEESEAAKDRVRSLCEGSR